MIPPCFLWDARPGSEPYGSSSVLRWPRRARGAQGLAEFGLPVERDSQPRDLERGREEPSGARRACHAFGGSSFIVSPEEGFPSILIHT